MQFTWEVDGGHARSRQRAWKACVNCKRNKKRCIHLVEFGASEDGDVSPAYTKQRRLDNRPKGTTTAPTNTTCSASAPVLPTAKNNHENHLDSPSSQPSSTNDGNNREINPLFNSRFISELSAEAALIEDQGSMWKEKSRPEVASFSTPLTEEVPSTADEETGDEDTGDENESYTTQQTRAQNHLQRYLHAIGAFDLPTKSTQRELVRIYFAQIHPILPLLDKYPYLQDFDAGTAPPLLTQAICLVAAKDDRGLVQLRFDEDGPALSSRAFCTKLYTNLTASVNAGIETSHLILARVLALMSCHCEGYRGADFSDMHLTQAIHHSHCLGLQRIPPDDPPDSLARKNLFWCLWSLDMVHAVMGGRPVFIADRDLNVERPDFNRNPQPAFEIWLKISDVLAAVIDYYRPTASATTTGWEMDFPGFEDLMGDSIGSDLKPETLGILELYYHFAAISSHKCHPRQEATSSTPSAVRQSLSALRILALLADEFPVGLPPLLIIPSSLSFSITVTYRQLRQSTIVTQFNRAKARLESSCDLLQRIARLWWPVRNLARLNRRALRKLNEIRDTSNRQREQQLLNMRLFNTDGVHATKENGLQPSSQLRSRIVLDEHQYATDSQAILPPLVSNFLQDQSNGAPSSELWYGLNSEDINSLLPSYADLGFLTDIWNSNMFNDSGE